MPPRTGHESPQKTPGKPAPAPPVEDDDEDDGDFATPKRDRDYENDMYEKGEDPA